MSVLRFGYTAEGHALPELHVGPARAGGLRNSLRGNRGSGGFSFPAISWERRAVPSGGREFRARAGAAAPARRLFHPAPFPVLLLRARNELCRGDGFPRRVVCRSIPARRGAANQFPWA